jgi:hypothetical protein
MPLLRWEHPFGRFVLDLAEGRGPGVTLGCVSTTAMLLFLGPVAGAVAFALVAHKPRQRPPRRALPTDGPLDWRATRLSRVLVCLVCIALSSVMIGDSILAQQASWWDPLVLAPFFSPLVILVFWPRLALSDDGYVTVRNVRTRRFPLTETRR